MSDDMMTRRHRAHGAATLLFGVLLLLALVAPASAAVTLVSFTAEALVDDTILVSWEVGSELDTSGYRLYRSESASPTDWGQPLEGFGAGEGVAPQVYEYTDSNVTPGVLYYYLLEDISISNVVTKHGPVSAGVSVATNTPTSTATTQSSSAATATATRPVTGGTATLSPTPPPTATRQFANTPPPPPSSTPTRPLPATAPPIFQPTATPLPGASVATPTGIVRVVPTVFVPPTTPTAPAAQFATLTQMPTQQAVAVAPTVPAETATPLPAKDSTPIIFAASEQTDTSTAAASATTQGGRSTTLVLVLAGGAIGLAGLLAAVLLYLRSRRS